jgi:hypothetical protein
MVYVTGDRYEGTFDQGKPRGSGAIAGLMGTAMLATGGRLRPLQEVAIKSRPINCPEQASRALELRS